MKTVYALVDPRDSRVRYVGCSANVEHRLYQHMAEARLYPRNNPRKTRWLRRLHQLRVKPIAICLESVSDDTAREREHYWIELLAQNGAPLTNGIQGSRRYYADEY